MPSPSDHKPDEDESPRPALRKVQNSSSQLATAMELPFTLVGAFAVGVAMGYFLDRWLHTKPWFTLVFGALGFFAGVREVLRRLPGGNGNESG